MRWLSCSCPPFSLCWFPFWRSFYRVSFFVLILITLLSSVLFPACSAVSAQAVCKEQPVSMVLSPHGCLSLCLLLEWAQRVMIERVESVTAIPA